MDKQVLGTVIVVDDSQFIRYLVRDILEREGFAVVTLADGQALFACGELECADAILLDVILPDTDGFTLCRKLRMHPEFAHLPVIFLTALETQDARVKSFEVGGNDYLVKPIHPQELLARVRTHVRLRQYVKELEEKNRRLEELTAELERLAFFDPLTGVPNRRAFDQRLNEMEANHLRYGTPYALVVVDIDHFKLYNDAFGHHKGDELLRSLAELFTASIRSGDFVARFGGEEFVVLCFGAKEEEGKRVAERLAKNVKERSFPHPQSPITRVVTVSCGVCGRENAKDAGDLFVRADRALYFAKQTGRNRVCAFSDIQEKERAFKEREA
ncbi:diguanylate cyclase [Candidatus Caldatribacterium sp.]|uniref:diguanylate cyclase n=1 Tax=Candidatus Caldatribacterium sp. TaxID=2282143 RepID=UPI00299AE816|nr:diguanylate cyclase [Candidatus Caldatribacterium sp.]MDW8081606.1 diguanylate cyclase [Candidatus Calescibacterium sp.]